MYPLLLQILPTNNGATRTEYQQVAFLLLLYLILPDNPYYSLHVFSFWLYKEYNLTLFHKEFLIILLTFLLHQNPSSTNPQYHSLLGPLRIQIPVLMNCLLEHQSLVSSCLTTLITHSSTFYYNFKTL